jgi:hypothetical protein
MNTANFLAGHRAFVGKYTVIVREGGYAANPAGGAMLGGLPANLRPTAASNTRQTLATLATCANYVFPFQFEPTPDTPKMVTLTINPSPAVPGAPTCYFLPWKQNACTEMSLDDDADWFFTSVLSGCSVQVHGTSTQPTVAHSNGADVYINAYTAQQQVLRTGGMTDEAQIHSQAEVHANNIAQNHITGLFQNPGAAHSGSVTKMDYLNNLTDQQFKQARKDFKLRTFEFFTSFKLEKIGQKPKIGSFVYGRRTNACNWHFYYQSTVSIKAKSTFGKQIDTDVVLGPVTRFF